MYEVKMIFVLVQIGSNLWVNPMQIQAVKSSGTPQCQTLISAEAEYCSDWSIDRVRKALTPAAVSKAMEGK